MEKMMTWCRVQAAVLADGMGHMAGIVVWTVPWFKAGLLFWGIEMDFSFGTVVGDSPTLVCIL